MEEKGLEPWRTELVIWHPLNIGGSVDLICKYKGKKPEEGLVIIDWKRSKRISRTGYKGKKMKGALSHLDSCNVVKYSLQQELYRYIMELYGFKVDACYLAFMYPTQKRPITIKVPNMRKDIEKILAVRRKKLGATWDEEQMMTTFREGIPPEPPSIDQVVAWERAWEKNEMKRLKKELGQLKSQKKEASDRAVVAEMDRDEFIAENDELKEAAIVRDTEISTLKDRVAALEGATSTSSEEALEVTELLACQDQLVSRLNVTAIALKDAEQEIALLREQLAIMSRVPGKKKRRLIIPPHLRS